MNWVPGIRDVWSALAVVVLTTVGYRVVAALRQHLWEPLRLRRIMVQQGVPGPPFRFLLGNAPDLLAFQSSFPDAIPLDGIHYDSAPTVVPQYSLYFPIYGNIPCLPS